MTIDVTKLEKVKTALDNRYENKQSNKRTVISGSYSGDNDSYPTVLACINKFGELITSWSVEPSDNKYPSEKLVKTELGKKIDKSQTAGLVKNDGTIDTTSYVSTTTLSNYIQKSQTNGLVKNDGTIDTNTYLTTHQDISGKADSDHTHGNISNDGKVGSVSGKPLITTTNGVVTTGDFGTSSGQFAEGNHTHVQYLTSHQTLAEIGGEVTVEKQSTAETGYVATYVVKQDGVQVGSKINIPKDYLVKSASMNTCSTADSPVVGYSVGDKYLDFVINAKDNSDNDEHIYISVSDLIDVYTADNTTLQVSNNQFSIKNGGVGTTQLSSGVQTSLGYADAYHNSPASSITSTQISNWDTMASTGVNTNDIDARINQALDDLAELIYPTSNS